MGRAVLDSYNFDVFLLSHIPIGFAFGVQILWCGVSPIPQVSPHFKVWPTRST